MEGLSLCSVHRRAGGAIGLRYVNAESCRLIEPAALQVLCTVDWVEDIPGTESRTTDTMRYACQVVDHEAANYFSYKIMVWLVVIYIAVRRYVMG